MTPVEFWNMLAAMLDRRLRVLDDPRAALLPEHVTFDVWMDDDGN